jgi:hypothetical protein
MPTRSFSITIICRAATNAGHSLKDILRCAEAEYLRSLGKEHSCEPVRLPEAALLPSALTPTAGKRG